MYRSKVFVQYRDGSKPKGAKVVLGFSGGMTKPTYTSAYGEVLIEHASTGRADVFVSGKKCGSFIAPGETVVFL